MKPPARQRSVCTRSRACGSGSRRPSAMPSGIVMRYAQRGQHRQRQCGIVALRRGLERLRRDLQADEHEDGEHGGARQPLEHQIEAAEVADAADEQGGRQGVRRSAAHLLVGGMTDVRRRLKDAAEQAGHERGHAFGQKDGARVEVVAGRRGALGAVDAADDRRQDERQHHRQLAQSVDEHALPPGERVSLVERHQRRRAARRRRSHLTRAAEPGPDR